MQQFGASAFYTVVRWHELCEVDTESTLHISIVLAICLPKIIKFGWDLMKFWQKTSWVIFFWHTLYYIIHVTTTWNKKITPINFVVSLSKVGATTVLIGFCCFKVFFWLLSFYVSLMSFVYEWRVRDIFGVIDGLSQKFYQRHITRAYILGQDEFEVNAMFYWRYYLLNILFFAVYYIVF